MDMGNCVSSKGSHPSKAREPTAESPSCSHSDDDDDLAEGEDPRGPHTTEVSAETDYDSDTADFTAKHHVSFACMHQALFCIPTEEEPEEPEGRARGLSVLNFLETAHAPAPAPAANSVFGSMMNTTQNPL
eukprot:TRINITY_DN9245_c0_g1_i1.p1 TRINITY_DN9245_c0_g1~~TRINITY_DN9245_c0_g1_i1.p1  ORF type:complete len:131 (+),score=12.93 TRINITY_DN9245_c0_g1_i1:245-637(+)